MISLLAEHPHLSSQPHINKISAYSFHYLRHYFLKNNLDDIKDTFANVLNCCHVVLLGFYTHIENTFIAILQINIGLYSI